MMRERVQTAEPDVPAPERTAPVPFAHAHVLALQRSAGNQAVARMLGRRVSTPQAPQASQAPPAIGAILHEGQYIATGLEGCRTALERVAARAGGEAATAWATRFFNMDPAQRASLEAQHGPELVAGTVTALRAAEAQFVQDNKTFLMNFETRAGNVADELLTVSEGKLRAEQERLGVKAPGDQPATDQISRLRDSAAALLPLRREADRLGTAAIAAREALDGAARSDPFHLDPAGREKAEAARQAWSAAEKRFAAAAGAATAEQPALALYTTGGDAAEKLRVFSSGEGGDERVLAIRLQTQCAERLENIALVRGALGGRFKPLKQPPVVRMTKEALAVQPYQARLVDDHIKAVQAAEDDSKQLWSLIALGLGLVAMLPTAGTSAGFVGTLALAAGGAAGIGAYQAYEELQDARLQAAGAESALDKAQAICQDEPDYVWLALDILAVFADIASAGVLFKEFRAAMREAKAENAASLQRLARQCEAVQLTPASRGRVFGEALGPKAAVTFEQMLDVFRRLVPPPGEEKWLEYAHEMSKQMYREGRVVELPEHGGFVDNVAKLIEKEIPGTSTDDARKLASKLYMENPNADALYIPDIDAIVVRMAGTPELVASFFVHELTHKKQKTMEILGELTHLERELSAFASQREFLKLVPLEAIPEDYHWLREASDAELFDHVFQSYNISADANRVVGRPGKPDLEPSLAWKQLLDEFRGRRSGR